MRVAASFKVGLARLLPGAHAAVPAVQKMNANLREPTRVGFLLGGAAFTDQYTFQLVGLGSQFITIASSQDPVVKEYTISDDDLRGPFAKKIPAKMETMKELPALAYTGVREKLAEKFHMSEALLTALNPGRKFEAGETIVGKPTQESTQPAILKRRWGRAPQKSADIAELHPKANAPRYLSAFFCPSYQSARMVG